MWVSHTVNQASGCVRCMNNNVCEKESMCGGRRNLYIWEGSHARERDNNAGREVRRLTLPHFQDHLHALRGAHSASHAVQALARPIRRSWRDGNEEITQLVKVLWW